MHPYRLSILDRYLFAQFLGPFLLAVGGFLIIGIIDILFTLVDLFINAHVPLFTVCRLLLYKVPAICVLFFPMALLFSMMLLLIRLAKDNELTVLRSSGVPTYRILLPLLVFATLTSISSYIINDTVVPWANHLSDTLIRQSIHKTAPPTIMDNIFFKESENRFFYIRHIDTRASQMSDILIFDQHHHFPRIITAKRAHWTEHTWQLFNGHIHQLDSTGKLDFSSAFQKTTIQVNRDITSFYSQTKTAKEMDSRALKEKINTLSQSGINTRLLQVEYHMKISIPIACLVFGLLGMSTCIYWVQSGKDWWGMITAIISVVLLVGFYFFMVALCRSLGKKGALIPIWAAWIPNIVYGVPSLGMMIRECRRR